MPKPNDEVDVALLHALDINAVDFLITQDPGIHTRARRASPALGNRVLTVSDAVAWLRAAFESLQVRLPLVEEMPAHAVPLGDEIFDSLRERYLGFDEWWRTKCVPDHRPCWVVSIDGEIAGLVVRKEKTHAEAKTHHRGPKILKVCTFKVKPRSRRGGGWNWVGVVSGSFNPNDSGVGALERRPRHDKGYHEGGGCRRRGFAFR